MVAGPGGGAVLDGVLERVTFANPETGYTIARIAPAKGGGEVGGGADLITAVGPLLGAQIGEFLRLRGRWSSHPKYGRQFEVPLLRHGAARHRRGHPEIPGLGPDQGHRPGHGRTHGRALRHRHHARHRRRAGPPGRGRRAGPQADRDDRRRLGRAEGDQGGDDLPAGRRGIHLARGADLQEIRRRVGLRRPQRAVPAGRRRAGDRSRPPTRSHVRSASPPTARSGSRPAWPTPCPRPPTTGTATCPPPT